MVNLLDLHKGETAVIMGNGPSLKDIPKDFLTGYITFGMNFINRLPYAPTYYVCIDSEVLKYSPYEIFSVCKAAELAFLSSYVPDTDNWHLRRLRALPNHVAVGENTFWFRTEIYMSGNTGVYVALKIAYEMGFQRVLLVGVDHTADFKHFCDDYPEAKAPNMNGMKFHIRLANQVYMDAHREIINLSPPSGLDVIFKRGEIKEFMVDTLSK